MSTYQDQSIEELMERNSKPAAAIPPPVKARSEKALSEAAAQPVRRTEEGNEKTLGFGSLSP